METLTGHTSQETAYVVDDYPYGYTLRCKIRYWIESKAKFGYRFVSQTTNPRREGEHWNKPKPGTYQGLVVMIREDDTGHIKFRAIRLYPSVEEADKFQADHGAALEGTPEGDLLNILVKIAHRGEEKRAEKRAGIAASEVPAVL